MIQILQNIIEAMKAAGYDVDAHYGPNWMLAFKSPTSNKVAFSFPPFDYDVNPTTIERFYRFEWFCVYRYSQNEIDEARNIATLAEIEDINNVFSGMLLFYTDSTTGVQPLVNFGTFRMRETFDTMTFNEPVIGFQCSVNFNAQIENQC